MNKINARNSPLFKVGKAKWEEFVKSYTGPYDLSISVYAGMNQKVEMLCPEHGSVWMDAKNLMNGKQCRLCYHKSKAGKYKLSTKEAVANFKKVHGEKYDYSRVEYRGLRGKIDIICPDHGLFYQSAGDHLNGSGCVQCFNEERRGASQRDSFETFSEKVKSIHGDIFDLSHVDYKHSQQQIAVICKKHKKAFSTRPYYLTSGANPCPQCGHTKSNQEQTLVSFVRTLIEVETRKRSVIPPKEVDLWVPSHNLAIEYHGLYWHSFEKVGNSHRQKWEMCQERGIRLIQIFEDEWLNKRTIVENRIKAALGKTDKFDARKTKVVELARPPASDFLREVHIQGPGRASAYYGLTYNNEIVAVASFGRARSGAMTTAQGSSWEVIRYASKGRVRGGFSKLFKRFLTDYQPESVVSYCDLRYGDGRLYKACGFELDGITDPDYWWVPYGKTERVPRYQTQKHKLPTHPILKEFYDPNKSEAQICHDAGWYRIYGVGHQRWIWTPST